MAEPRLYIYSIRQSTVDPDGGVNERSGDRVVITTFIGDRNIFSAFTHAKINPHVQIFLCSRMMPEALFFFASFSEQ